MLNSIHNISYLNKKNKKYVKIKSNKIAEKLMLILIENNFINSFTKTKTHLYIYLKINNFTNEPKLQSIKNYTKFNRIQAIKFKDLQELNRINKHSLFILYTSFGLITIKTALRLKVGGRLIFKIN